MKDKKIIFMGTPSIARTVLEALDKNFNVIAVVTQPDKRVGRKQKLVFSPVKDYALEKDIKVLQPVKIREDYEEIISLKPDLIVTCAYGQIVPKEILDAPKYGCINAHASLLPKYRGGAPIERAIQNGEAKTGITIMYMDEKMDAGDMIEKRETKIHATDNKETLTEKLAILASQLLLEVIPTIFDGSNKRVKQNEDEVSFAPIIKKSEEKLLFNKSALEVFNHARSLEPDPGVYAVLDNKRYKLFDASLSDLKGITGTILEVDHKLHVACQDRALSFSTIQEAGKNKMTVKDYFNGRDKNKFIGRLFNED